MEKGLLEGKRLFLRPLSFNELSHINSDKKIETPIELEAVFEIAGKALEGI